MTWRILEGDVRVRLADLADGSVQCVVTSPPYWGLRDYGADGQLGLEPTPEEYVANMVEVFRDVRRVLRDDGTVWLNLGDSYTSMGRGGRRESPGVGAKQGMESVAREIEWAPRDPGDPDAHFRWNLPGGQKPKDLVGIPWMVAFALRADGWYLRSDIIWAKPNPMPESVTDRPTKAHEYVFLLTKSARYYFDADAVREPNVIGIAPRNFGPQAKGDVRGDGNHRDSWTADGGRNIRTVWSIATEPFPGAHFATFPKKLVVPCVKAGSAVGDTVLDPFAGSGTVGLVAARLGRSFVGIELNPDYAELARNRIRDDGPLFNVESEVSA